VTKIFSFWLTTWFSAAICTYIFYQPSHQLAYTLYLPELFHPLGFDSFGRDLLLLTLQASFLSASFALSICLLSCISGMTLGTMICFFPKKIQFLCLRAIEFMLSFPSLLLALAWAAIFGPGWSTLFFALAIGTIPSFVRLCYLRSQEVMAEEFVLASTSMGASPISILSKHLLPTVFRLCSIKIPNLFAHALLAEATLSFLGVGAPVGRDTWGSLLAQGQDYLIEAPHIAFGVGIPLVITIISLQKLSETMSEIS